MSKLQSFQKNVEYPLDDAQHARIREAIVKEATRTLVGRYFIEIYGPLGAGLETVSFETYAADELAKIDLEGGMDARIATPREEVYRRIPIIYKDFELHWRDVDFAKKNGSPLDVTRAIRAAHFVADREDDLVFNGHEGLGIEGLLNVKGAEQAASRRLEPFRRRLRHVQARDRKSPLAQSPPALRVRPLASPLRVTPQGERGSAIPRARPDHAPLHRRRLSVALGPAGKGRRRLDGSAELRPRGRAGPRDRVPRAARHELSIPRLRERRPADQAPDRGLHAGVIS